jgi:hypothetical protein
VGGLAGPAPAAAIGPRSTAAAASAPVRVESARADMLDLFGDPK